MYELAQYAFLADRNGGSGLTWSKLHDDNNGMTTIWIILVVEWAVFLVEAWYLDQARILMPQCMVMQQLHAKAFENAVEYMAETDFALLPWDTERALQMQCLPTDLPVMNAQQLSSLLCNAGIEVYMVSYLTSVCRCWELAQESRAAHFSSSRSAKTAAPRVPGPSVAPQNLEVNRQHGEIVDIINQPEGRPHLEAELPRNASETCHKDSNTASPAAHVLPRSSGCFSPGSLGSPSLQGLMQVH